jgi:predicted metalloprotease with PDZ domain
MRAVLARSKNRCRAIGQGVSRSPTRSLQTQTRIPMNRASFLCLLLASVLAVLAALPATATVPAPADTPYPGTITLAVDASDIEQRIFRVHEEIPVTPGPLTLLYPEWLPGNHSPSGPIRRLAGLLLHAGGKRIEWTRDPVDVFAFHLEVPAGANRLDADFQFVSPTERSQGRITLTPEIVGVQWNTVVLYPAGHYASRIRFQPSVTLPHGWQFGCALERSAGAGDSVRFEPVALDTLVDSPLIGGRHFRRFDLDPGAKIPVHLDVVADEAEDLVATPEFLAAHRKLVQQAYKLFGSQHYAHYDFLLALTDRFGGIGLEHHQSSEDSADPDYFTNPGALAGRDLLPHEYTHSWNGKFRRPADLWTPNYNVPMQDSLLWVYEGQTQYWGYVLSARSGLLTAADTRDALALVAAGYDHRVGRSWRDLEDTTNDPIVAKRRPQPWRSWQRSEDYYSEGQLVWLDVDTKLRELTRGRRSLDDFAHAFFGVDDGRVAALTYTFDDVVHVLDAIAPYDWAGLLQARLHDHAAGAPLDGLARGGWKLVYTDQRGAYARSVGKEREASDFSYSIGLSISTKDDGVREVMWDSPAFKAGLMTGMTVLAVNGIAYEPEVLERAITAAKGTTQPIALLVKTLEHFRTIEIDWHGGLRYPHLERIAGTPDRLGAILAARR